MLCSPYFSKRSSASKNKRELLSESSRLQAADGKQNGWNDLRYNETELKP